ncbi:MAG: hypothetical protein M1816_007596 [Peltula sp. TS41687]|nr:MAG: hypothetical protein M1816_007596 [Peltula sp. TS41687]
MQRHHSLSEFDPMRPQSASNLQGYYANQRYQPRASEAEQMLQQKRRMAAQRERELRNYHQEQQYNRSLLAEMATTQGKPDRTMSPAMSEEGRRELIARQHRALYGKDGSPYPTENGTFGNESNTPRPAVQGSSSAAPANTGIRGPSPLSYDQFGANKNQAHGQNGGQLTSEPHQVQPSSGSGPTPSQPQQRSRANSTSSPASNPNSFSLFENGTQQSSRTSTSSPGGSPPRQGSKAAPVTPGHAPIGTRPSPSVQAQVNNPALNKRSTTPLPSPLSYGFSHQDDTDAKERSTSSASNPSGPTGGAQEQNVSNLGWGSKSGVWGSKSSLGVQASVWG